MKTKKITLLYLFCDLFAAMIVWILFFIFRKYNVNHEIFSDYYFSNDIIGDSKLLIGGILIPIYWLILHSFSGYYNKPIRKSRVEELITTFFITLIGTLLFFFAFILDDIVNNYSDYTRYFVVLFGLQFLLTYLPRVVITTKNNRKIQNGQLGFNTLIVGGGKLAESTYQSLSQKKAYSGNFLLGYILLEENDENILGKCLTCLGKLDNLPEIVKKYDIEELIIAIPSEKRQFIEKIITMTYEMSEQNLTLKLLPLSQDFLVGIVKTSAVMHEPFITISQNHLPNWQRYTKRFFDLLLSFIAVILLLPVYAILAIGVKISSPGPVLYSQERIGYKGKPFNILKFRSMFVNAEQETPQLSSKDDKRITNFGKFMRKTRLDETPQFFNVLKGDMSLVGPRPERQYYIDQIVKVAPYYKLLQNIKPGITSWGQVKFGYAENVDEMVERLKWDILYMENRSIQMDIKILIYTVLIILERKGK